MQGPATTIEQELAQGESGGVSHLICTLELIIAQDGVDGEEGSDAKTHEENRL